MNLLGKKRKVDPNRKEKTRRAHLKKNFRITIGDYNKMLEDQSGKCAICGVTPEASGKTLAVDHNHKTNKVRGLLCSKCNQGMGLFKEDINTLSNAILYIERYNHS